MSTQHRPDTITPADADTQRPAGELIVMTEAWEHEDRLRSYELLSQLPVVSRAS